MAFFEQCHQADQVSGVLDKLKKGKKKVDQESDSKKALTMREQGQRKIHTKKLILFHKMIFMITEITITSNGKITIPIIINTTMQHWWENPWYHYCWLLGPFRFQLCGSFPWLSWWTHLSIAFACEFLTLVGLRLIPYLLHRVAKWSLNSLL